MIGLEAEHSSDAFLLVGGGLDGKISAGDGKERKRAGKGWGRQKLR